MRVAEPDATGIDTELEAEVSEMIVEEDSRTMLMEEDDAAELEEEASLEAEVTELVFAALSDDDAELGDAEDVVLIEVVDAGEEDSVTLEATELDVETLELVMELEAMLELVMLTADVVILEVVALEELVLEGDEHGPQPHLIASLRASS